MIESKTAISLYRQSLRILKDLPIQSVRRKMAYNVRELFEIYKDAPQHKIDEVILDGTRDLALLKEILKGKKESVYNLFKSFDNLNETEIEDKNINSNQDSNRQILPL